MRLLLAFLLCCRHRTAARPGLGNSAEEENSRVWSWRGFIAFLFLFLY